MLKPLRERGRLKIGGRTNLMRWCIRLWQMSPCTKWHTNTDSHTSYTTTDSSLLHQRLVFPYVWVSTMHGTDVPVPPQLSRLPRGVKARLHHERIVVCCTIISFSFNNCSQYSRPVDKSSFCSIYKYGFPHLVAHVVWVSRSKHHVDKFKY